MKTFDSADALLKAAHRTGNWTVGKFIDGYTNDVAAVQSKVFFDLNKNPRWMTEDEARELFAAIKNEQLH